MESMNNNEIKRFNVDTIKEFVQLPSNEKIIVNDCLCKIIKKDNMIFGVKFYYEKYNSHEIKTMKTALLILSISREYVYINKISETKDLVKDLSCEKIYIQEINSEDHSLNISVNIYRAFNGYSYLNDMIIAPLACFIKIKKRHTYLNEWREDRRYIYFDIYGDSMLEYENIYYPELKLNEEDKQIIDRIFQDISDMFNKKYIFHKYGEPYKIFKPNKD